MSTVNVKKCDLCDALGGEGCMFVPVGTTDVCVSCLYRLERAATLQLVVLSPPMAKAIQQEVDRMSKFLS
jgi:hypothetical protein